MNTALLIASNIAYAAGQWVLLIFLARQGDLFILGNYSFAQALLAPIFTISLFGFRNIVSVDGIRQYRASLLLRYRIYILLFAFGVTVAYLLAVGSPIDRIAIVILLFALKAAESVSDLFYGISQRDRKIAWQAQSIGLRATLLVAVVGSSWLFNLNYLAALTMLAIVSLVFAILHDGRWLLRDPDIAAGAAPGSLWRIIRAGAPLAVASAIGAVAVNSPRYALEQIHSTELLGAFTAIYSFSAVLSLVGISIGQSHVASLASAYRDGDKLRYCGEMLRGCLLVGFCIAATAALIYVRGEEILRLTFGAETAAYSGALYVLIICSYPMVTSQLLAYASVATGGFVNSTVVNVATLAFGLPSTILLVDSLGLYGACYAVGTIGLLNMIGYGLAICQMWRRRTPRPRNDI